MGWTEEFDQKIYTVDSGASFVDQLAAAILRRYADDFLALSRVKILLPTRRSVQAMQDAFLRQSNGASLILPSMFPVGSPDEQELQFFPDLDISDIPKPMNPVRRTLILVQLVRKRFEGILNYEQALSMAAALGKFIDDLYIEDLTLDALDSLVPDDPELSQYWQGNVTFLKDIIQMFWPSIPESYGCVDPGHYRVLLLKKYAEYWRLIQPQDPVIIAGTLASVPAVAELMKAVLALPKGCVLLPGLDLYSEEESWNNIEEGHAQYLLKSLLERLDVERADVHVFPYQADMQIGSNPAYNQDEKRQVHIRQQRMRLACEAMRPAQDLGQWTSLKQRGVVQETALEGLTLCEVKNQFQEARLIACLVREALETPEQKIMIVTPNRKLAALVQKELLCWDIHVDDSAGLPLSQTNIGRWFLSAVRMIESQFRPLPVLSFFKNSLASGGAAWPNEHKKFRSFLRRLEDDIFRDVCLYTDLKGLDELVQAEWNDHDDLLACWRFFLNFLQRLEGLAEGQHTAMQLMCQMLQFLEDVAATAEQSGDERLWMGDEAEQAALYFGQLMDVFAGEDDVFTLHEFLNMNHYFMQSASVRPKYGLHPRVAILGLMEARLQSSDLVILAGLNENSWPADPGHSPWMSRPMAKDFGMPRPERALTQSAHDFVQLFCCDRVYLTRSLSLDGAPSVPARWIKRLDTVIRTLGFPDIREKSKRIIDRALTLHRPLYDVEAVKRPAPVLPEGASLSYLTITDAGALISDPYALYAKRVLKLIKKQDLDRPADVMLRGELYHEALEIFTKAYPNKLPANAYEELITIGEAVFEKYLPCDTDIRAFWWPRFKEMAKWFVSYEQEWREQENVIVSEAKGRIEIETEGGTHVILNGRADRLEKRSDGYAVIDYKTGAPPAKGLVECGQMPQLTLCGAMLKRQAFEGIHVAGADSVSFSSLSYWKISGKDNKADLAYNKRNGDPNTLCDEAYDGAVRLLGHYNDQGGALFSCPLGSKRAAPMSQDYFHLSRLLEWSVNDEDEGEAA